MMTLNIPIRTGEKGVSIVAVLNIRNLPREVHVRLRVRAARAGRSMEAEARVILTETCMKNPSNELAPALQDWVDALYASGRPHRVVASLIAARRRESARE
jgi:plasmid stability protein